MRSMHQKKIALLAGFLAMLAWPWEVSAQCRTGSGPDMGDGIPYCASPAPAGRVASWHSYAAAIAWSYFDEGRIGYVSVSNYRRLEDARVAVLDKCHREGRKQKGWTKCELADAAENGVLVLGKTKSGGLLTRFGSDPKRVRAAMIAQCLSDGDPCKVLKTIDSRPQYY